MTEEWDDDRLRGWNGFIELGLKGAESLRRSLQVDELAFRGGLTLGSARDYFAYGALGLIGG